MDEKVSDIRNALYDIKLKFCHLIKSKRDYYYTKEGDNYLK